MDARELALLGVVLVAFTVESTLGFGATLVTLGVGSALLPIEAILPAFVPASFCLSVALVGRNWPKVQRGFLLTRLLPFMALGLPLGVLAFRRMPGAMLERSFAAFVLLLTAVELFRALSGPAEPRPLPRGLERALLILGGAIHGAFATGGPMAVYVGGRSLDDKGTFRATLSALWVVLNLVLGLSYLQAGSLDAGTLRLTLLMLVPLALGLFLGEKLHGHVPERSFRFLVLGLLCVAALRLLLKS